MTHIINPKVINLQANHKQMETKDKITSIRNSYEDGKPNESFIYDILYNVVDVNEYKIKGVTLPFSDDIMSIWKQQLKEDTYVYLFPYLVLCQWLYQNPSSADLQKWIKDFLKEKDSYDGLMVGDKVENEMHFFISDDTTIKGLNGIAHQIGFYIDTYFWHRYKEIPFFKKHIKESQDCSDILYNDYIVLLMNSLKTKGLEDIVCDIYTILDYCKTIDLIKCKDSCFLTWIKYLCTYNVYGYDNEDFEIKDNDINIILSTCPFWGDEIGLAILDFCVQNSKTYNIKLETISAYKEKLYVESWLFKINKRLKPGQLPYNVDLCENTTSYDKIIDTITARSKEFWEKCIKMSLEAVEKVKLENPSDKVTPVKTNIMNQLRLLCIDEIREIYTTIYPLIIMARKEGILLFLSKIRKEEKKKRKAEAKKLRKKIEFNEDVFTKVYNRLINTSNIQIMSDFSCNVDSIPYKTYADLFAKTYIIHYVFIFSDDVNEQALSEKPSEDIKKCFKESIWESIILTVLELCKINFGGQVTSDSQKRNVNPNRTSDSDLSERGTEIFVGDWSTYP